MAATDSTRPLGSYYRLIQALWECAARADPQDGRFHYALSAEELEAIGNPADMAETLSERLSGLTMGLGCLLRNDLATAPPTSGNFTSSDDLPPLLWLISDIAEMVAALSYLAGEVSYAKRLGVLSGGPAHA